MDWELTTLQTETHILDNIDMESPGEEGNTNGLLVLSMKGTLLKERKMDRVGGKRSKLFKTLQKETLIEH